MLNLFINSANMRKVLQEKLDAFQVQDQELKIAQDTTEGMFLTPPCHELLGGCWQQRMPFINRCEEANEDTRTDNTAWQPSPPQEEKSTNKGGKDGENPQMRCGQNHSHILRLQTPFHHSRTSPPPPTRLSSLDLKGGGCPGKLHVVSSSIIRRKHAAGHCSGSRSGSKTELEQ